jgi:hypothetical protein
MAQSNGKGSAVLAATAAAASPAVKAMSGVAAQAAARANGLAAGTSLALDVQRSRRSESCPRSFP